MCYEYCWTSCNKMWHFCCNGENERWLCSIRSLKTNASSQRRTKMLRKLGAPAFTGGLRSSKSTTASLRTHFHSDWSPVTTIEQSCIKTKCLYSFISLKASKSADGFTCSWPFEAPSLNCKSIIKSCSLSALLSQPKHLTGLNWNPPFQEVFGPVVEFAPDFD